MSGEPPDPLLRGEGDGRYLDVLPALVERSGLCMAAVDRHCRITAANVHFCRQLGRSPADLAGVSFRELVDGANGAHLRHCLADLFAGRRTRFDGSVVVLRSDGTAVSGEVVGFPVRRAGSAAREALLVFHLGPGDRDARPALGHGTKLTELEATILEGVASGIPAAHLAKELYLSRQGVDYHIGRLLRIFHAPNRPALVARAYAAGFLPVAAWPPQVMADRVERVTG